MTPRLGDYYRYSKGAKRAGVLFELYADGTGTLDCHGWLQAVSPNEITRVSWEDYHREKCALT